MANTTRGHIHLLDGFRGVAAVSVVAYHYGERVDLPLAPHGYLAVDFFFVLSGFVISLAYADRLQAGMKGVDFLSARAIRLWPMLLIGTALGAVTEIWRPVADVTKHLVDLLSATVAGGMAIPMLFPTSMEQTIFPLNGPVWSLFLELAANAVFLLVIVSARPKLATVSLVVAGVLGLGFCAAVSGTLDVGALVSDWPEGLPRVVYSFFAGVLLFMFGRRLPTVRPDILCLALVAILVAPRSVGLEGTLFDFAIVAIAFPLLVGSAAKTPVTPRLQAICKLSGDLSYPLYTLHYPVIRVICFVINRHATTVSERLAFGLLSLIGLFAISYAVLRLYDQPLRRRLTQWRLQASATVGDCSRKGGERLATAAGSAWRHSSQTVVVDD